MITEKQYNKIVTLWRAGHRTAWIVEKLGLVKSEIYNCGVLQYAKGLRSSGYKQRGVELTEINERDRATTKRRQSIIDAWMARPNATLEVIGKQFGITRERVRQICQYAPETPPQRKERKKILTAERHAKQSVKNARGVAKRSKVRQSKREDRICKLDAMWRRGATIEDLQEAAGFKNSETTHQFINRSRKAYDDVFPPRKSHHWYSIREIRAIHGWYENGTPIAKIADRLNICSPAVNNNIKRWRDKYPMMFSQKKRDALRSEIRAKCVRYQKQQEEAA